MTTEPPVDPGAVTLEMEDSRRLTGPNLFWDLPGAAMEVRIAGMDPQWVLNAWQRATRSLLAATGFDNEDLRYRLHRDGATLVISAPIDACYAMCSLNEAAWDAVRLEAGLQGAPLSDAVVERLRREFDEERKPALLALQQAAADRDVPFLWDDDEVSVGFGASTQLWPADALPEVEAVDWDRARSIPVGLVTGTNGKSTTVRMAAAILNRAGLRCGLTSTDFIRVGRETVDTGDYSGPGGARMLMRHPRTEVAVLEVARGGLLRRGLGVYRADAALVTNVAADHLGDYGIHSVAELVPAKFIVRRALHGSSPLILCADDPPSVAYAATLENQPITWFGLDGESAMLNAARERGDLHYTLRDGHLCRVRGDTVTRLVSAEDIPAAMGGFARYNLRNALAAAALTTVLGADDEAIAAALQAFRSDADDNPGRGNLFEHNGVRILLDFAHNEHGVLALAEAVRGMSPQRCMLLMGQAGDRPDNDIRALTRAATGMSPDRMMVCALPGYERGREPMDVPELIREEALAAGVSESGIEVHPHPVSGVESALQQARPGDLLVLLALTQREAVLKRIQAFVGSSSK